MNAVDILTLLADHPRANLLPGPSPIHKLPRLSATIGYEIYCLRDDLTGFALGGNKTRKLDYLVGDALAKGADTIVTQKASALSRNAAAAGRMCGLEVHVVIGGSESDHNPLSRAFFEQCGAGLHYVADREDGACEHEYRKLVQSLRADGSNVYELHPGGSDEIGALAYIAAFQEIVEFSETKGVEFSDIVLSTGSVGTQAGLIIGHGVTGCDARVLGISASQPAEVQRRRIHELCESTARMLAIEWDPSRIAVDDKFIGPGYAIPSDEGKRAVDVFATNEGILLDQVYTGKAAAGLLDYAANKKFRGKHVLFVHTGGNAGLYY